MFPQVNGSKSYPELILCQLQALIALVNNINGEGTTPSISNKMLDPFSKQVIELDNTESTLTIPSDAEYCIIGVKGTGEVRLCFGSTPIASNSFSYFDKDIVKLESVLEMEKANLVSTNTNTIVVQYYRTLTI